MLIDTHCHLDFPEFDHDRELVINRAHEKGVMQIINVGSSVIGSRNSVDLAARFESVFAAVGIHPHEADSSTDKDIAVIKSYALENKVVAIGEIGLDYFKNYSLAENQRALFKNLLALAKDLNLAVVLHCRQAQEDMLAIIKEFMPLKAVVHCFSGDESFLKRCLQMGFLISFTCNITYKKAENLRDVLRVTPMGKLLLETDAPYLSPEGFRGRRNEPYQVRLLAEEIARLKKLSFEEVATVTTHNAKNFFNLE